MLDIWSTMELEQRLQEDFAVFLWAIWRELKLKDRWGEDADPTPLQYDIARYLSKGPRRRMVQAFRGCGKSWITAAYVLWRLHCNPNERILVVSASKDRADAFSIFVKRLIDEIEWLQYLRPDPAKQQRDSLVAFDVGPSDPHQAPSVRSVGISGQLTGGRATLIVADDVEVPKNSLTVTMRDKLTEAVKEFDAVLVPDGEVVYLGTPQTIMSLYNGLPARGYQVRIWPARYPTPDQARSYGYALAEDLAEQLRRNPSLAGKPVEPTRFDDTDLLEREASYGRSGFALQFMLDTSLSDANRYPLKMSDLMIMDCSATIAPVKMAWGGSQELVVEGLQCVGLPGDRLVKPMYIDKAFTEYQGCTMSIDPSGRGGDETGYAVVAMLHGILFTLALGGCKGGYERDTLLEIANTAKRLRVKRVVVEPNFGDGMFVQMLKPIFAEIGYPVEIEDTPHATVLKDSRIIDTLEPVFNQHRMVVDRSLIESDRKAESEDYQAFFQMTRITKEKGSLKRYDRLDAWAMAVADWVAILDMDNARASESYREDALLRELQDFEDGIFGGTAGGRQSNWISSTLNPKINGIGHI